MMEKQKQQILKALSILPILSTDQAATFFRSYRYPQKRASEALSELAGEKLIEGRRRLEKSKVWRLSKKGRTLVEVGRAPVPLQSLKVEHYLALGNVYFDCFKLGGSLGRFLVELNEPFQMGSLTKHYRPDIYLEWEGYTFLLEVQQTPLSTNRWGEKHAIAQEFFGSEAWKQASWQLEGASPFKPPIVILSERQEVETIQGGSRMTIKVIRSMEQLKEMIDKSRKVSYTKSKEVR